MRVMVFFDLPSVTAEEKREYRKFRRSLIKSGFIMVQESVYSKLALNMTAADAIVKYVRSCRPHKGQVQILVITEKQYSRIEYITGEKKSDVVDSDERLVIL